MSKELKLVSVVIPVYNVEGYLKECLDSVISQPVQDMEIICINDGSVDSSLEILKMYKEKDTRIKVYSQENKGLSATRNRGLKEAVGKYVYFLDSDDYLVDGALDIILKQMDEFRLDILCFSGKTFYETKELERQYESRGDYYNIKNSYEKIQQGSEFVTELCKNGDYRTSIGLKCFRTDFVKERNLTFEEGVIYEDNGFAYKSFMSAERVMQLDQILYNRRVRKESIITKGLTFRNFYGYFRAFIDMNEFIAVNKERIKLNEYNCKPFRGAWGNAVANFIKLSETEQDKIQQLTALESFYYLTYFESAIRYRLDLVKKNEQLLTYKGVVQKKQEQYVQCKHNFDEAMTQAVKMEEQIKKLTAQNKLIQQSALERQEQLQACITEKDKAILQYADNEKRMRRRIRRQKKRNEELECTIAHIKSSYSYKFGCILTFFPRKIRSIIRKPQRIA